MNKNGPTPKANTPPIYVVSGSMGAIGEQLVRKIASQFQGVEVPVKIVSRVHHHGQIEKVVEEAAASEGTIVNTLVNPDLSMALLNLAQEQNVVILDIVGPLLTHLAEILVQEPTGKPCVYRQLYKTYFKRIEAIEFTLAHDDGVNFHGWSEAEIVLVGVSRVGKTPLSLYLSMQGWKVANVPFVPNVPPRPQLFELNHRRVVVLDIDPTQLLHHRQNRQNQLGTRSRHTAYTDPKSVYEEVRAVRRICRRGGFRKVDITHKPIETSAEEIITLVNRRLKPKVVVG